MAVDRSTNLHLFFIFYVQNLEFALISKIIYTNLNTNIYQLITYEGELKK